jgi:hypothetical protein
LLVAADLSGKMHLRCNALATSTPELGEMFGSRLLRAPAETHALVARRGVAAADLQP